VSYVSTTSDIWRIRTCVLCQSFTLALEQIMASLSTLQLALHQTKRLPRREDGFSCLAVVSVTCGILWSYDLPRCQTYLQHSRLFGG
jgi:hypothetical protein